MRSVCQALNLVTMTLGSMVSAGVQSMFASWFTNDLNDGKLEGIFLMFAVLCVVNMIWFISVSKHYVYKEDRAREGSETERLLSGDNHSNIKDDDPESVAIAGESSDDDP